MSYSINVSQHGRFAFEINRLSDEATLNTSSLSNFVAKLRKAYPSVEGYKITVNEIRRYSVEVDI